MTRANDYDPPDQTSRERRMEMDKDRFLQAFAELGIVGPACKASNVNRGIINSWLASDPNFRDRYDDAEAEASDLTELEVRRRGQEGFDEPVIFQGVPSMTVDPQTGEEKMLTIRRYSDSLLLALMKARRPDKFRENSKITHDGNQGVLIVPGTPDPTAWAEAVKAQQADWAGTGDDKAAPAQIEPPANPPKG